MNQERWMEKMEMINANIRVLRLEMEIIESRDGGEREAPMVQVLRHDLYHSITQMFPHIISIFRNTESLFPSRWRISHEEFKPDQENSIGEEFGSLREPEPEVGKECYWYSCGDHINYNHHSLDYCRWRQYLLLQKINNNQWILNELGDRRANYLYIRQLLIDYKTSSKAIKWYAFKGMYYIKKYPTAVDKISFSPKDPLLFVLALSDGTLSISDPTRMDSIEESSRSWRGHLQSVTGLTFSLETDHIVSSSLDRTVRVWEVDSTKLIYEFIDCSEVTCMILCPFLGQNLVVANLTGDIKFLSFFYGECLASYHLNNPVSCIMFSQRGDNLFLGDRMGSIYILHVSYQATGCELMLIEKIQLGSTSILSLDWRKECSFHCKIEMLLVVQADMLAKWVLITKNKVQSGVKEVLASQTCCHTMASRALFCPYVPSIDLPCIIIGDSQGIIDIHGYSKAVDGRDQPGPLDKVLKTTSINRLSGHQGAITDISWNKTQDLLATSDEEGLFIIWNRNK